MIVSIFWPSKGPGIDLTRSPHWLSTKVVASNQDALLKNQIQIPPSCGSWTKDTGIQVEQNTKPIIGYQQEMVGSNHNTITIIGHYDSLSKISHYGKWSRYITEKINTNLFFLRLLNKKHTGIQGEQNTKPIRGHLDTPHQVQCHAESLFFNKNCSFLAHHEFFGWNWRI